MTWMERATTIRRSTRRAAAWLGVALLATSLSACAAQRGLAPAPGATPVPDEVFAATAASHGIQLTAETEAWTGEPPTFNRLTPVLVTITNESDEPLRIRYEDFALVDERGAEYAALPPFDIEGVETRLRPVDPYYDYQAFYVAPHHARFYPHVARFDGRFYFDHVRYGTYHTQLLRFELPTDDMLDRALPEGVVDPHGKVRGFLYFEEIPEEVERVTLRNVLVDPDTGEGFATLEIPFVARELG